MKEYVDQSLEWEMMKDRYGSTNVDDIIRSPLFLSEFEDWIAAQEQALHKDEFSF